MRLEGTLSHVTTLALGAALALGLGACSDPKPTAAKEKANVGLQTAKPGSTRDSLTIATLNMSVGWRAEDLVLKQLSDSFVVNRAMQSLYQQYQASDAPRRMRIIASYLYLNQVDVLALQETQTMRAGDTATFSFVDSLLADLAALGGPADWTVIRQPMNRIALDVPDSTGARMKIDFWEGNTLLVRPTIQVLDTHEALYATRVNFNILGNPVGSSRGYLRARLKTPGGAVWAVYNTHLEVDPIGPINLGQAQELNGVAWDEWQRLDTGAQVVVGDLNSKPGFASYLAMTSKESGLVDLWAASGKSDSAGFSCCIPAYNWTDESYNRRIDYVLGRNVLESSVQRLSLFQGFWGSDHAMLSAVIRQQL